MMLYHIMNIPVSKFREIFTIGFVYAFLAGLLTLPWLTHPSTLYGVADVWQVLWNFWWVKLAFTQLHTNVFFTQFLHAPIGISLLFHTLSLVNTIPGIVLQKLFSLVTAYHILIYVHFVLAGVTMYVLVRKITHSRFASFAAGYLFTFSQYHVMRSQGHLNLFTIEWMPLYAWFLLRILERRSWKNILGAALCLALTAYADLYYLVYLLTFSVLFMVYAFTAERRFRDICVDVALMGLIAFLLVAPLLVPLIYQKTVTTNYDVYGHDPLIYSADVQSLFVPGPYSLYAKQTISVWQSWTGYWESNSYPGYILLAVVAFVLWHRRRSMQVWFWAGTAAIFGILSMGPYLHVGGITHRSIPLPYIFFMKLPIVSLGGVATRFFSFAFFALLILLAVGIADLPNRFRHGRMLAWIVFALIAVELFPAPIETSDIVVPRFYEQMAQDAERYSIIDVSYDPPKTLYYQTIHHKPLIDGYTSRPTVATQQFMKNTPVLSDLFDEQYRYQYVSPPKDGKEILRQLNIKYILIPTAHRPLRKYLDQLHLSVAYKGLDMMVYEVY